MFKYVVEIKFNSANVGDRHDVTKYSTQNNFIWVKIQNNYFDLTGTFFISMFKWFISYKSRQAGYKYTSLTWWDDTLCLKNKLVN